MLRIHKMVGVITGRRFISTTSVLDSLPASSPSWYLMEKTIDYATDRGGVDEYSPWLLTDLMQNTISFVHEVLPPEFGWLGAVAVSALGIRSLIFPLCLSSIREGRLKTTLLPQYSEMLREMSEMKTPSSTNPKDSERLQALQKRYIAFTSKYGNVALKGTLASGIQIPMIMTGIVACNGIAMNPTIFPSVALESPLWLTSAALPDPLYILPAINAGLVWGNMRWFGSIDATATPKLGGSKSPHKTSPNEDEQTKRIRDLITSRMSRDSAERTSAQLDSLSKSKMMKYGKKMFPLFIFGVTAKFPAITIVYTISNILGAMAQNFLVSSKRVQVMFEIPAQARKNKDEIEEAIARADEIREKISQIVNERKSKRFEMENAAREKFRKPQRRQSLSVVGTLSEDPVGVASSKKTIDDLLREAGEKKRAKIGEKI